MKRRIVMTHVGRLPGTLVSLAAGLALSAATARAGTPLAYATTWRGENGSATAVAFEGTAERGVVSGTLRIEGTVVRVNGVIALDGSVSGTVKRPDGSQVATFTGRPDANGVLRGEATFAGRTRSWSADGVVLPSATAP
jgi:hypothetical protein